MTLFGFFCCMNGSPTEDITSGSGVNIEDIDGAEELDKDKDEERSQWVKNYSTMDITSNHWLGIESIEVGTDGAEKLDKGRSQCVKNEHPIPEPEPDKQDKLMGKLLREIGRERSYSDSSIKEPNSPLSFCSEGTESDDSRRYLMKVFRDRGLQEEVEKRYNSLLKTKKVAQCDQDTTIKDAGNSVELSSGSQSYGDDQSVNRSSINTLNLFLREPSSSNEDIKKRTEAFVSRWLNFFGVNTADSESVTGYEPKKLQGVLSLAYYYAYMTTKLKDKEGLGPLALTYAAHWIISDTIDEGKDQITSGQITEFKQYIVDSTNIQGVKEPSNPCELENYISNSKLRGIVSSKINFVQRVHVQVKGMLIKEVGDETFKQFSEFHRNACQALINKQPDNRDKTSATGIYLLLKVAMLLGNDFQWPKNPEISSKLKSYVHLNSLYLGRWNDFGDAKRDLKDKTQTKVLRDGPVQAAQEIDEIKGDIEKAEGELYTLLKKSGVDKKARSSVFTIISVAKFERDAFFLDVDRHPRYQKGAERRKDVLQRIDKRNANIKKRLYKKPTSIQGIWGAPFIDSAFNREIGNMS